MISGYALDGLPEIEPGYDLAGGIVETLAPERIQPGDVVVVAHKAVSKSEGRIRALRDVTPGERALAIAREQDRDPRHVQVILDEARYVVRAERGILITETRHGYVCANSGVDASNVPGEEVLVLLPVDPDASARGLRARLQELTGVAPGVVITDSFGRAWRAGQCDVAIGCAGVRPVADLRGEKDIHGRELKATVIAVADELAAAADLCRSKAGAQPVVLIRGAERQVTETDGPGAAALVRAREQDLFR
ncbi:MAG TPA: coenzyme F420-0:L-glutamate ligase [Solirubrobacteraceae bacterium]|nr:coenzyme F420-0:L-glutamate ligase [Solirubrobacteraceae bacterium]